MEYNKNFVYGFKAFNIHKDGTIECRGHEYKPGQVNTIDVDPVCCSAGFHFCENLRDVNGYYQLSAEYTVVYPVIAVGKVSKSYDKCCTDKLFIWNNPLDQDYFKWYGMRSKFTLANKFDERFPFPCHVSDFDYAMETGATICGKDLTGISYEELLNFNTALARNVYDRNQHAYQKLESQCKTFREVMDLYTKCKIVQIDRYEMIRKLDEMTAGAGHTALNLGLYKKLNFAQLKSDVYVQKVEA